MKARLERGAKAGAATIGLDFVTKHAGTQKGKAEAEADAAKYRKRAEPAEFAADVMAIGDRKALDEGPDRHALDEGGEERSAGKAGIPDPPHPLCLVAELERYAAQDQARQHNKARNIEGRKPRPINDGKGTPQHDAGHDEPGLIAVPDRRHGTQHGAPSRLVSRQTKENADA